MTGPPEHRASTGGGSARRAFRFLAGSGGGLRDQVFRSGFWVGVTMIGVNGILFVRSIVLARLLTPEIFGLMGICIIVIRGMELFSETGVRPALIHRKEGFEAARDTGFSVMVMRGFLLAGVAIAIAPLAAWYYEEPILAVIIRVLALSFVFNGLVNINTIALEKKLEFRRLAVLEQSVAIVNFAIVVALAWMFRSVWALVAGHVFGALLTAVASYLVVPGRPGFRFDRRIAVELLRYGRFITGLTIVLFLTTELDNLVVGKVMGMEALGYYLVAYTFANLPTTHISKIISKVMFPAYSILQDDHDRLKAAFLGVLQVVGAFAIPVTLGTVVLAPDIVRVVYGERWLPAAAPLAILAVFGGVRAIGSINGYLYNAIGKPNVPFWINLVKLAVIGAVIVPATRAYGLVGVSLAVTIPMAVFYFVSVAVMSRVARITARESFSALAGPSLAGAVMTAAVYCGRLWFGPVRVPGLVVLVALGAVVYLLLNLRLLRRLYRVHVAGRAATA